MLYCDSKPPPEFVFAEMYTDPLFLTLYKELYYRHIYSKLAPTLDQRFESYENYCDLFNYILGMNALIGKRIDLRWFFC